MIKCAFVCGLLKAIVTFLMNPKTLKYLLMTNTFSCSLKDNDLSMITPKSLIDSILSKSVFANVYWALPLHDS